MVDYVPPLMPFVIERIEHEKPIPPSVMYMAKNQDMIMSNMMVNGEDIKYLLLFIVIVLSIIQVILNVYSREIMNLDGQPMKKA